MTRVLGLFAFLGLTLLSLTVPLQATAAVAGSPELTEVSVGNYQYISRTRVSRTVNRYTYSADVTNNGESNLLDVVATLSEPLPRGMSNFAPTQLDIGELAGGATATRTFSFDWNKRLRGRLSQLQWTVTGNEVVGGTLGRILGRVMDTGGSPIADAAVKIGTNTLFLTTGSSGTFLSEFSASEVDTNAVTSADQVQVTVSKAGYTRSQAQVTVSGIGGDYDVAVVLKPVAAQTRIVDPIVEAVVLDASEGGALTGKLDIPPGAISGANQPVKVEFTPLDPGTDPAAFPGSDFLALGSTNPGDETTLDSVVLAEVKLIGDDGAEYSDLGAAATLRLRIPESQQGDFSSNVQEPDAATETIPIWTYNEDTGLWEEDGTAGIFTDTDPGFGFGDGVKYAKFSVTHFTWWNVDRPISAHACFKGELLNLNSVALPQSLRISAEGVTYNGTSYGERDYAPTAPELYGVSVKRSDGATERVRLFMTIDGVRSYLTAQAPTDPEEANRFQYTLTTDAAQAHVFDTPDFSGSTRPNPDVPNCQTLHIQIDANRAPLVSIAPLGPQPLGEVDVPLIANIIDADGNFDGSNPANYDWQAFGGCSIVAGSQTATGATLRTTLGNANCQVRLTATDDAGASGSDEIAVLVRGADFVPGGPLSVVVVDRAGNGVPNAAIFLNNADGTLRSLVGTACVDVDEDEFLCRTDSSGFADFSPIDGTVTLTIAVSNPFPGSAAVVTHRDIPSGPLTLVSPLGDSDFCCDQNTQADPGTAQTGLLAQLLLGDMAQAGASSGFDFGVQLNQMPQIPAGEEANQSLSSFLSPNLWDGNVPISSPNGIFPDVFLGSEFLEYGGTFSAFGQGLRYSSVDLGDGFVLPEDLLEVKYGFVVDQLPFVPPPLPPLGVNPLHIELLHTPGVFDILGPFEPLDVFFPQPERLIGPADLGGQVLFIAWRGGQDYPLNAAKIADLADGQVAVMDLFPGEKRFVQAIGEFPPLVVAEPPNPSRFGFDSQTFGPGAGFPDQDAVMAGNQIVTDALDVEVLVSAVSFGGEQASATVTVSGPEAAQMNLLRVQFIGFNGFEGNLDWSVIGPAISGVTTWSTPDLPSSIANQFGPSFADSPNPDGSCGFGSLGRAIAAALHYQPAAANFWVLYQNAVNMGFYEPLGGTSDFFGGSAGSLFQLLSQQARLPAGARLQGTIGLECVADLSGGFVGELF